MSTETYHVAKFMADVHMKYAQHVQCVTQCLALIHMKIIHTEGDCVTRDINNRISWEFLNAED